MTLSILVVTKGEPHAVEFIRRLYWEDCGAVMAELVIVADGDAAADYLGSMEFVRPPVVHSQGFIESVLDEALTFCSGDYILRLDDDERCSPAMVRWLAAREYEKADHWKFPRANLWPTADLVAITPQLWPDRQTRLSVKAKAGGRTTIHAGSPFGGGEEAPCVIEHHKFLVKSLGERRAIVQRYDSISPGMGTQFLAFSCPEDAYPDGVEVGKLGDGTAAKIVPEWRAERIRRVA